MGPPGPPGTPARWSCLHRHECVYLSTLVQCPSRWWVRIPWRDNPPCPDLASGDRPKNAEDEFPGVSSMPRGCYEPWGLSRKPLGDLKVSDCLRQHQTGGLRRYPDGPFEDVIRSECTPQRERAIADHPSIKPQSFLRRIVLCRAAIGRGCNCRSFHGGGFDRRCL